MLIRHEGAGSALARAVGADFKGWISLAAYVAAILAAWFAPWVSKALYMIVAAIWFVPDRRIERVVKPT